MIDRNSPLPLWAQISEDLRVRTAKGEFDNHFPTEEDLARTYGVSRQTVREAIRRLEADGLVIRERGRGTSLAPVLLEQPINAIYSMASTVRAKGLVERSEVVSVKRDKAPSEAIELLGDDARDAIYIERIRYAGDDPIGWDRSWLPSKVASVLLDLDLSSGGIYELLDAHCGIRITGGWERIQPIVPSLADQRRLGISKDTGVFSINRLALSGSDPVEWRRSRIRGDRYSLVAQWPRTSSRSVIGDEVLMANNL